MSNLKQTIESAKLEAAIENLDYSTCFKNKAIEAEIFTRDEITVVELFRKEYGNKALWRLAELTNNPRLVKCMESVILAEQELKEVITYGLTE